MHSKKFDPKDLEKLNRAERLQAVNPDRIWNTLDLREPKTLIDIGAGTGFFAVPFCKKMEGGKVYACDISDDMLRWMNEHLPSDVKSCVIPTKMAESVVPLPDGTADLVYMINLHHELDRPQEIVREAHRLLKAGGKLMIIDWKKEETPEGPPVSIRVTEEDIIRDMNDGGFGSVTSYPSLPSHHFVVGKK